MVTLRCGRRGGRCGLAVFGLVVGLALACPGAPAAEAGDCFADHATDQIEGCSKLIEGPSTDPFTKSFAYARRALAYSLKGEFEKALPDYDAAIDLNPMSAMAHNNRAWVMLKLGRIDEGLTGVRVALEIDPRSYQAHDTLAHLKQAEGEVSEALRSYEQAMRLGGEKVVALYQCGLVRTGHYRGAIDGAYTLALRQALEACVSAKDCDPLPPDEDCRDITS